MQKSALLLLRALVVALLATSAAGCHFFRVYKADLDQGNLVTREMVDKLKPGMTPAQVRYVLGTPLVTDTLNPRRWDYVYSYVPGTYARYARVPEVKHRRMTVWFENGVMARTEGTDDMPTTTPVLPESQDKSLTAEPL